MNFVGKTNLFGGTLSTQDPEIFSSMEKELERQRNEIELIASQVAGTSIQLQFTPHLVPMVRGLLVTVYARLRDPGLTAEDCRTVLKAIYKTKILNHKRVR